MIVVLFKLILCTYLLVMGWTIASQDSMVLNPIRVWAEKFDTKWADAFFLCVWCNSSSYAILGYGMAYITGINEVWNYKVFLMYPLVVCGSSLVCGLTWTFYLMMNQIKETFTEE